MGKYGLTEEEFYSEKDYYRDIELEEDTEDFLEMLREAVEYAKKKNLVDALKKLKFNILLTEAKKEYKEIKKHIKENKYGNAKGDVL